MTRLKSDYTTAGLDEAARERIVADIDEARATLTDIMGEGWQPTSSTLADKLRNKGRLHEVM